MTNTEKTPAKVVDLEYGLEGTKFIDQLRSNVKSDLIEITEDKLENILLKHLHKMAIRKEWITPFSLFLTVLLANLTATFAKKFGIDADVWHAFFLLFAFASFIWLVWSLVRLIARWKGASIDNLIAIIKDAE